MTKIASAFLGFMAGLLLATPQPPGLYPMAGYITEIDRETDTFLIEANGNLWEGRGVEDFEAGDLVACIMSDNGTDIIYDDSILAIRYCG